MVKILSQGIEKDKKIFFIRATENDNSKQMVEGGLILSGERKEKLYFVYMKRFSPGTSSDFNLKCDFLLLILF